MSITETANPAPRETAPLAEELDFLRDELDRLVRVRRQRGFVGAEQALYEFCADRELELLTTLQPASFRLVG